MSKLLLQDGLAQSAGELLPRWLRIPAAVRYSGMSRSRLYEEMARGTIRSASLKGKHQTRGSRLIDRFSLDEFIDSHVPRPDAAADATSCNATSIPQPQ
jgi:hypothetical protein